MVERLRERGLLVKVLIAFAIVYFIWGSTFLAIRVAIAHIPPLLMCGVRLVSAGALLVALARARGDAWPRGIEWRNAALVGILLPGVGNSSVSLGETHVASGLVSLLVASIPLWMALLAAFGTRAVRPSPRAVAGLLLGFGGIGLLIGPGLHDAGHASIAPLWALIPVAGSFSWAWGSLWSRRVKTPASPFMSTGVGLVAGGLLSAIASGAAGEFARFEPAKVTAGSLAALAYLAVFGSVLGVTAYLFLLRTVSPAIVSTYAFVNPIVALFLGRVLGGEALGPRTLLAAALVIASVVLITTARAGSPARDARARVATTGEETA